MHSPSADSGSWAPSWAEMTTRKRFSASCSVSMAQPLLWARRVRFSTAMRLSTRVSTEPAPVRLFRAWRVLTTGMGQASPTALTWIMTDSSLYLFRNNVVPIIAASQAVCKRRRHGLSRHNRPIILYYGLTKSAHCDIINTHDIGRAWVRPMSGYGCTPYELGKKERPCIAS